mmetsp:Transcript_81078/g.216567  ORF Transcript_81078/g.216567 Transcript_81078/m.216567 type:complete len:223 (-) Transcript_81078:576-1244(-)
MVGRSTAEVRRLVASAPPVSRESHGLLIASEIRGCCQLRNPCVQVIEGVRIRTTGSTSCCSLLAQITFISQGLQQAGQSLNCLPLVLPVRFRPTILAVTRFDLHNQTSHFGKFGTFVLHVRAKAADLHLGLSIIGFTLRLLVLCLVSLRLAGVSCSKFLRSNANAKCCLFSIGTCLRLRQILIIFLLHQCVHPLHSFGEILHLAHVALCEIALFGSTKIREC